MFKEIPRSTLKTGRTYSVPIPNRADSLHFFPLGICKRQTAAIGMNKIIKSVVTLITLAQTKRANLFTHCFPAATKASLPTHSKATVRTNATAYRRFPQKVNQMDHQILVPRVPGGTKRR